MPDEETTQTSETVTTEGAADTSAAEAAAAAATAATEAATETAATQASETAKTFTEAEVMQRLKGQGKELKDAQAKLAAFEKAEEERKLAEMTEVERLKAEAEARQKANDDLLDKLAKGEAMGVLAEAKVKHPIVIAAALPPECKARDAEGNLTAEAKAAIGEWLTAHPGLVEPGVTGNAPGAAAKPAGAPTGPQIADGPFADHCRKMTGGK